MPLNNWRARTSPSALVNAHAVAAHRRGDFDWRAYFENYAELLHPPTSLPYSEQAAWAHYGAAGRAQGRVAVRLPLRLRYSTAGGLTNQLYAHLSAFLLARAVGAEVLVLAPFVSRSAFAEEVSTQWNYQAADTIFDVAQMQAFWRSHGLALQQPPITTAAQVEQFMTVVEYHSAPTPVYGDDGCSTIQIPMDEEIRNHLPTVVQRVRREAVLLAERELASKHTVPPCINADTGNTFFRFPAASALHDSLFITHHGFIYKRTLVELSDSIKRQLGGPFLAAHLRIEEDADVWNVRYDRTPGLLQLYIDAMRNASFASTSTVYVASGLLFNGTSPEFDQVVETLRNASVAGRVVYKEQLLDRAVLQGLHSEQLALLDLLVLTGSQAFVGHPFSTLSALVDQLRVSSGFPAASNHYIAVSDAATNDRIFDQFALVAKGYMPLDDATPPSTADAPAPVAYNAPPTPAGAASSASAVAVAPSATSAGAAPGHKVPGAGPATGAAPAGPGGAPIDSAVPRAMPVAEGAPPTSAAPAAGAPAATATLSGATGAGAAPAAASAAPTDAAAPAVSRGSAAAASDALAGGAPAGGAAASAAATAAAAPPGAAPSNVAPATAGAARAAVEPTL